MVKVSNDTIRVQNFLQYLPLPPNPISYLLRQFYLKMLVFNVADIVVNM